jgi:class 3 adenylate cyclase
MKTALPEYTIEQRISGSFLSRFLQELFRNTGYFPLALILLEFLIEGLDFLKKPDIYLLIPAVLVQAYVLTRWHSTFAWQRLLGSLVAPALYTVGEMTFEGLKFFESPYHVMYLTFALVIGLLQAAQLRPKNLWSDFLLLLENLVRAEILFALYVAFETYSNPTQTVSLIEFFADGSHQFLALAVFLLGISAGLANVSSHHYSLLLRQTADQLKVYSEWLLGRNLLGRAINDPNSMRLSRQKRTMMFADIRGFTNWCERRSPEEVASLLNRYYLTVEGLFNNYQIIKYKFTADEVMAVFIEADEAVRAARELQETLGRVLFKRELGIGIGIHTGLLVEGLFGGQNVRFYDVIGDTVNTAERIEKIARAGEIWISEDTRLSLASRVVREQKQVTVKGKDQPIEVYLIP